MVYKIYNQNNYASVPYPNKSNPAATIKTSGCGVCSMAMVMRNLAGIPITIADLAAYSIKHGARASSGTNMRTLAAAIVKDYPELTYTTTNDEAALRRHLEAGGMAIMNADGNDGVQGIFAAGGHYLAILGVRDGRPVIGDPAYTTNRYKSAYRRKYVTELGDDLITCDWSTLDLDTKYRSPNYYLFTKKTEEKDMTEEQVRAIVRQELNGFGQDQLPSNWAVTELQEAKDAGITDGINPDSYVTREQAAVMSVRAAKAIGIKTK